MLLLYIILRVGQIYEKISRRIYQYFKADAVDVKTKFLQRTKRQDQKASFTTPHFRSMSAVESRLLWVMSLSTIRSMKPEVNNFS
ncbi:MAG: hypothetical protein C4548_11155 [Desulfobacteraceae bacterium]|nr:MAG: hypothetical protein C4548_11155 [Desulfobacteraceae bacterium]